MCFRPTILITAVVGLGFGLAGPAQASQAAERSSDAPQRPAAQARWCVPCGVAAAAAVVRAARAIKAARAAKKLREAGKVLKARARQGVQITAKRARKVREQAARVVRRGKGWVKRNWNTLTSYAKACFYGVVSFEAYEGINGSVRTLAGWRDWLADPFNGPGILPPTFVDDGYRDLYYNPNFDFKKTRDAWVAACGASMTLRGLTG